MADTGERDRDRDDGGEAHRRPPLEEPSSVPVGDAEPEWADRIRELRRARGDRLKQVFATFDDEEDEP